MQISIHALREEGDSRAAYSGLSACIFLSTPSARRATRNGPISGKAHEHFYPRPPRGGRLLYPVASRCPVIFLSTPSARRATAARWLSKAQRLISIHALREEGDLYALADKEI